MSEHEIDSIMSLIHEASFQRISIGTPCVNKEGKVFNVVGLFSHDELGMTPFNTSLYANMKYDKALLELAGLYHDPENLQRQDLVKEKLINTKPLLDLDFE